MAEIVNELELRNLLCDPVQLYQVITGREDYSPKTPLVEGDCELLLTNLVARGRIVIVTMVHACRQAFLSLLSIEDAVIMRERLGELVPEVASTQLRESMQRSRRG